MSISTTTNNSILNTTKILFLLFSLIFVSVHTINVDGSCDHTQDNHKENSDLMLSNIKESNLIINPTVSPTDYPSLRIQLDGSLLEKSRKSDYYTKELLPAVIDYLQGALRIKRPVQGLIQAPSTLDNDYCNISSSRAFSEGVEADLLLVVVSSAEYNTGFAARSSLCYRSLSGRPIVSKLRFNTENVPLPRGDPLIHERNIHLTMHEVIHSLGFLKGSYNYFLDEYGNRRHNHFRTIILNGQNRTILDVEPLTERLRQHYSCQSIPGALLENDGGASTMDSHFERRLFLHEVMTSGIMGIHTISEFTLALLEGSGWYVPDYSYAEPFSVGQGQGCEFWEGTQAEKSNLPIEYCAEEGIRGCTATGRAGGLCQIESKTDGYRFFHPIKIYDCEHPEAILNARLKNEEVYARGAGSKCFSGTLSEIRSQESEDATTFCFKYNCKGSGLDTLLEVMIGNKTVVCNEEGPTKVQGFAGELVCPDPLAYCNTIGKQYCPRNCMGRGDCMENKKCKCDPGFGGVDCSITVGKPKNFAESEYKNMSYSRSN